MGGGRARVRHRQGVPDLVASPDGSLSIGRGIEHEVRRGREAPDRSGSGGRVVAASDRRLVRGADRGAGPELAARAVLDVQRERDPHVAAGREVADRAPERRSHQARRGRGDRRHSLRQRARNDDVVCNRGTVVRSDEDPRQRGARLERAGAPARKRDGDVGSTDEGSGDRRRQGETDEHGAERRRGAADPRRLRVQYQRSSALRTCMES